MRKVVTSPSPGQDVWIMLDVSRTKWVYNVRWDGEERRRLTSPAGIEHLERLVGEYAGARLHVGYEACGFGYEIAWWCQGRGILVTVVPPSTVERAPGSRVKTDALDAAAMNRKHERGELKAVHVPTRTEHDDRQLSRTYGQVLKDRKRAQMRVRSLMQEQGLLGPLPSAGWKVYAQWVSTQAVAPAVRICIEQLLAERAVATQATKCLKAELLRLAEESSYKGVIDELSQQAGVGRFTAIRLRLEIGDIRRFTSADSFTHYLGLTPSEYSSGEIMHRGHLRKCGPGHVRAWLVQCAWASVMGKKADRELLDCYRRIQARAGKKRAIVAVARRLAMRLRARWLEALTPREQAA
jgi:transposase